MSAYNFTNMSRGLNKPIQTLMTTLDNVVLDNHFNSNEFNFETLVVSGRGILKESHSVQEVAGRDGKAFLRTTKEPREITIKARITANTSENFRKFNDKLNLLLDKEDSYKLEFNDEDYYYNVHFSESSSYEETSNTQIIELVFIDYEVRKYHKNVTTISNRSTSSMLNFIHTPDIERVVKPYLEFTLNANGTEIIVKNEATNEYVRLIGNFSAGNKIKIDFEKRTVMIGTRLIMNTIDIYNSRFFDLVPKVSNKITFSIGVRDYLLRYRSTLK